VLEVQQVLVLQDLQVRTAPSVHAALPASRARPARAARRGLKASTVPLVLEDLLERPGLKVRLALQV
jgi:hypothetical protein